jgi:hypothetical protein
MQGRKYFTPTLFLPNQLGAIGASKQFFQSVISNLKKWLRFNVKKVNVIAQAMTQTKGKAQHILNFNYARLILAD